jgi:hypothetical protein
MTAVTGLTEREAGATPMLEASAAPNDVVVGWVERQR